MNKPRFCLLLVGLLFTLNGMAFQASAQSDSTASQKRTPFRQGKIGWVKLYPFNAVFNQYRIGFELIIAPRFSAVSSVAYINKGPYGTSQSSFLAACEKFVPTKGVQFQLGLRHYLDEYKSNWRWFVEGNFFFQQLTYQEFSFVPANQCEPFHPWYKRIAPLQRDFGGAFYFGQQVSISDHSRLESYLGLSLRGRYEDQRQVPDDPDSPYYHYPTWFQEFRQLKAPFWRRYIGIHVGFMISFGG